MKLTAQGYAVLDDGRDNHLSRYVERNQRLCYDDDVFSVFLPHIRQGDVVADIGAAIGDHTCAYIQKAGDPKLVHAFECNPMMLECLKHNCPQCNIHPVALSDKNEALYFHQDDDNAGGGWVGPYVTPVPVEVVTLDSFGFQKLDFIKMDVEGHEVKVIRGAVETIKRCSPTMILEVRVNFLERAGNSMDDLMSLLNELGYSTRMVLPFDMLCQKL